MLINIHAHNQLVWQIMAVIPSEYLKSGLALQHLGLLSLGLGHCLMHLNLQRVICTTVTSDFLDMQTSP